MTTRGEISTRTMTASDKREWLRMRCLLWPDGSAEEHEAEIRSFFAGTFPRGPWTAHLALDAAQCAVGFAEVSIRPYAEGCETACIGYLEGWFVEADTREQGVGRALVAACEAWARTQGCTEFASDAEPDNEVSCAAHRAVGFTDAGLVRCFHKRL